MGTLTYTFRLTRHILQEYLKDSSVPFFVCRPDLHSARKTAATFLPSDRSTTPYREILLPLFQQALTNIKPILHKERHVARLRRHFRYHPANPSNGLLIHDLFIEGPMRCTYFRDNYRETTHHSIHIIDHIPRSSWSAYIIDRRYRSIIDIAQRSVGTGLYRS